MRTFFFAAFLFCASLVLAQGPELLRQQYGKSPYDYEFYRKWNFDVFIQPHLSNTTNRETKGRFNLDMGGNVHYRFNQKLRPELWGALPSSGLQLYSRKR